MASPGAYTSAQSLESEDVAATPTTPAGSGRHQSTAAGRAALVQNPPVPRKRANPDAATASPSRKPRRDRGPNWNLQEMLALVDTKRAEYLEELDSVDARDLMDPDNKKWERISNKVMQAGFSPCQRDHVMCKGKWNLLLADYRRISDYHARSAMNADIYWGQSNRDHVDHGLPKAYSKPIFERIDEWFGHRPQIQPPHVRDLLDPRDGNLTMPTEKDDDRMEQVHDHVPCESPDGPGASVSATDGQWQGCPKGMSSSVGAPLAASSGHLGGQRATQPPQAPLQTHDNPILLSLSDTGGNSLKTRPGNIGVRRRTSTAHAALVEATKSTGDVMVAQMEAMVGATRETEHNRLEVQMRLFSENMQYQREKDRRLHEQGLLASENARLAILKQGELVECLSQISRVLSAGLKVSKPKDVQVEASGAPKLKKTISYGDAAKKGSNYLAGEEDDDNPASQPAL